MCCEPPEWDSHEGNRLGTLRGLVACKTLGESFGVKIHQSHRRHVTSSIDLTSFAPNFPDSLLLGPCGDLVPLHAIDKVAQNGKPCSMLPTQRVSWTSANTKELRGVAKAGDFEMRFTSVTVYRLVASSGTSFCFTCWNYDGFLYICVEKINSLAAVLSMNGAAPRHHQRNARHRNGFQNRHKLE